MAVGTDTGSAAAPVTRAVILCHPATQPGAFIARFPGATPTALVDPSASGRISETIFTADPNRYDDEAVVVLTIPAGAPQLLLPQELQSTGDDLFRCTLQTGLAPAASAMSKTKYQVMQGDTHRLESVEPLIRRGTGVHPGTATLTITPVSSSILDVQAGTLGTAVDVAGLNAASPVKAPVGAKLTGRFFGFQMVGDNVNSVWRYLGAYLRGRRVT